MINHGLEQSDRIIIDKPNLTDGYMIRSIYGHVERGAAIEEVWAKEPEGKIRLLYEKKQATAVRQMPVCNESVVISYGIVTTNI